MASGNINTVIIKANLYAQWLPQYTRPVAILIQSLEMQTHTPTGNINMVPETLNLSAQWLSQYIHPVAILI